MLLALVLPEVFTRLPVLRDVPGCYKRRCFRLILLKFSETFSCLLHFCLLGAVCWHLGGLADSKVQSKSTLLADWTNLTYASALKRSYSDNQLSLKLETVT